MVIFVCGVVTGALVIKTLGPRNPPGRSGPFYGIPGQQPVISFMHQMTQAHIEMTGEQSNQIVKIMLAMQDTNAQIRRQYAPLLEAEAKRAHEAVSQILAPDQRPKLVEVLKEHPQGRGGRGEGGGRTRGGTNRFGSNGPADGQRFREDWDRHNQPATPSTNSATNTP